jgi:hypothetical protein
MGSKYLKNNLPLTRSFVLKSIIFFSDDRKRNCLQNIGHRITITGENKEYQQNKMDSEKIKSSNVSHTEMKFVIHVTNLCLPHITKLNEENCRYLP